MAAGGENDQLSKWLHDVAVTDGVVPESYVWPKEELGSFVGHDEYGEDAVPVIDLGGMQGGLDDTQRRQICDSIRGAFESGGAFQVVNHGVDLQLLERVQAVSKKFFNLPLETKEKFECQMEGDRMIGYGFHKQNKTKTSRRLWSEGLFVDIPRAAKISRTVWPEDCESQSEFSETMEEYVGAIRELGSKLLHLILNSLGIYPPKDDKFFVPKEPALLRMNHYPPCPDPSVTTGLIPHYDGNLITILHQEDVGGLQVMKEGQWFAVRPHPNAFVITAGNMLQVISNDICKSALHRAVVNRNEDRFSVAYFVYAPDWDQMAPLPDLVDAKHPAKYRPFTWTEYLVGQLENPTSTLQSFATDTQ